MSARGRSASPARKAKSSSSSLSAASSSSSSSSSSTNTGFNWSEAVRSLTPTHLFLVQLALSTPLVSLIVHGLEWSRDLTFWQTVNAYAFSTALCALWVYPLVWPGYGSFFRRANMATQHWHWFLSGVVVVLFQALHNWGAPLLHAHKGRPLAWSFEAYALSDSRWTEFNDGAGLDDYVFAINCNDVGLSFIALVALYVERRRLGSWTAFSPIVTTIALFRDATMWRETVEYLYQHHSLGYPYTTQGEYRAHAIANLYLVNIIWIVGPMLNVWVAAENIKRAIAKAKGEKKLAY